MEKTVVVLGQARSGTSMTAGLLNILGVILHQVDNPSNQNPRGAFEDRAFNGITSKMHIDFKKGFTPQQMKEKWDEKIQALLTRRSEDGLWGWKSALTHYNIEYFLPHMKDPHFVVVTRNTNDAAKSLVVHRRDVYGTNITIEHAIEDVQQSVRALEKKLEQFKHIPTLRTTYGLVKTQPSGEIQKFGDFLEVEVTQEMKDAADDFILPKHSTIK